MIIQCTYNRIYFATVKSGCPSSPGQWSPADYMILLDIADLSILVFSSTAPQQVTRPSSSQNVYSYEPTASPIAYSSPSQASASSSNTVLGRLAKGNTTSPTPAAAPWSLRQPSHPNPEGYQYSQPSPRSPGPTYTQLSGGTRSTTTAPAPYQWAWQGSSQGSDSGGAGSSGSGPPPQPQPHELSDMLQMLDQSGAASFEELNMFSTTFE